MFTAGFIKRFWSHVEILGPDECWLWKACKTFDGYGQTGLPAPSRKHIAAHRLAFIITHGPLGTADGYHGVCVLHSCDVRYVPGDFSGRACCNPSHLFKGTQTENIADMIAKGRMSRGEKHCAKITEQQARLVANSDEIQRIVAAQHGISQSQVSRIRSKKRWAHLDVQKEFA